MLTDKYNRTDFSIPENHSSSDEDRKLRQTRAEAGRQKSYVPRRRAGGHGEVVGRGQTLDSFWGRADKMCLWTGSGERGAKRDSTATAIILFTQW